MALKPKSKLTEKFLRDQFVEIFTFVKDCQQKFKELENKYHSPAFNHCVFGTCILHLDTDTLLDTCLISVTDEDSLVVRSFPCKDNVQLSIPYEAFNYNERELNDYILTSYKVSTKW